LRCGYRNIVTARAGFETLRPASIRAADRVSNFREH